VIGISLLCLIADKRTARQKPRCNIQCHTGIVLLTTLRARMPLRVTTSSTLAPIPLETLIALARTGDAIGIGGLYDRCAARLLRVAWRLTGCTEDAEDVVHDVFVGLPDALRAYVERGSFDGWLAQVTARAALMRVRRGRRRRESEFDEALEIASVVRADLQAEYGDLERQINALPDTLRTVFVLREIEGFSHDEIAALLDISPGASRVRLTRGLELLRTALGVLPRNRTS
jgi:RNA polymerase sigma-70 factor, ECF subfamily